jgi:transcriptional regulator with XRE-family HTH domain
VKPSQVRMARAALNWSLDELSQAAGVHRNTISNFETGKYAGSPEALQAIRRALERAGIAFTNGKEPGVKLKATRPRATQPVNVRRRRSMRRVKDY